MHNTWNNPYLILRLMKPYSPITFPAPPELEGYYQKTIKISDESSTWLRNALKCDYMGSAEFEFGAIPKSLNEMAEIGKAGELTVMEFPIAGTPAVDRVKGEVYSMGMVEPLGVTTYLICPTVLLEQAKAAILEFASNNFGGRRTKEIVYMKTGLFGQLEKDRKTKKVTYEESQYLAWYDLDNHWFLTKSKEQADALAFLLGI